MKKLSISFVFISILFFFPVKGILSQVVAGWQWAHSSGGTARDEAELPTVDEQGNVIICGKFSDTAWFGTSYLVSSGNLDMYIAKYNAAGVFQWARKAGSTQNAEGLSIASGPGSIVAVTGYFKGSLSFGVTTLSGTPSNDNFFIALYDSAGTFLWAEQAVGGHIKGKGVEFDPLGNVLVTGHYEDSATFGTYTVYSAGDQNAFLVKYSPAGVCQWVAYGGGQYKAWASSVGVDSQGNSYITGAFKDTADFGANTVITYGVNDVFLAKCSPAGNWIWAKHAGGTNEDYGNGIEVDVYGHIAVTGSFFDTVNFMPAASLVTHGAKDGFIAYYNPNGDCLWVNGFGGTGEDKGIGVSTDNIGNVYVTGFIKNLGIFGPIQKPSAGGDDIVFAKYSRTGQILWVDLAGGTSNDYGKGIQVHKQGVAYIAGYFEGSASFGNNIVITSKGNRETYVTKYWDGSPEFIQQPLSQDLCVGDSLLLSVVVQGANLSYSWYRDTVLLQGQNTPNIAILCNDTLATGKYTCIVSSISGYAVSDTAYVNVWNYPVTGLTAGPVVIPDHVKWPLTVNPGYAGYLWSTGDTTNSISYWGYEYMNFIGGNQGYISVTVTNSGGCESVDSVLISIFTSVDDENVGQTMAYIFPNPADNKVNIVCREAINRIEVFSSAGILSESYNQKQTPDGITVLDITGLPSGIYILRLYTDNGIITRKLIRE